MQARHKLLALFNQSWQTGRFPKPVERGCGCAHANDRPIKKRREKANYRPTSLLSCLGKPMERPVRLLNYLESNQLISRTPNGLQEKPGT